MNNLKKEKSPYLLQHAENPVYWQPWGDDAFAKAREKNVPVFLSIGYASCHWCHVMEKESFEDHEVADTLNANFVSIKVDREERPDVDAAYMAACQILSGSGGWPLSVFLTPDKKPFFAATYLPKRSVFGRPGLIDISKRITEVWKTRREEVERTADILVGQLEDNFRFSRKKTFEKRIHEEAYTLLERSFDSTFGGFDHAPKFPTPHRFFFLLRHHKGTGNPNSLRMVEKTLKAMRLGGIFDHVGYGFHRYSTDNKWLLPHFEKMLYDQALMAMAYLDTFEVTRNSFFSKTAREIFTYVLRDLTSDEGMFFSAEDADSEGEEGKFYIWKMEEISNILGAEDSAFWKDILNLSPEGNFSDESTGKKSGENIIHFTKPLDEISVSKGLSHESLSEKWEIIRKKLFQERGRRPRPFKDDKILTDWNGLMIAALARGAKILNEPKYQSAAQNAADFILKKMKTENGRLYHRHRDGETGITGQADDYAFLIHGLISLFESTNNGSYLQQAEDLQQVMVEDFLDENEGGFFLSERNHDLPVRPKLLYDGAIPSANSMSLHNLVRLNALTGNVKWKDTAGDMVRAFAGTIATHPPAYTHFLSGLYAY